MAPLLISAAAAGLLMQDNLGHSQRLFAKGKYIKLALPNYQVFHIVVHFFLQLRFIGIKVMKSESKKGGENKFLNSLARICG